MLQDIHWDKNTDLRARQEWNYIMISAPNTTVSRGTAILFRNTFEFTIKDKIIDTNGNFCITELELHNKLSIVICSLYGPNIDNPNFFQNIENHILKFNNPIVIKGGDWNATLNFKMDNTKYVNHNNPRNVKAIKKLINNLNLQDAWRVANKEKMKYTWSQGISGKQARLDYFLISEELLSITKNFKIGNKYRTDHSIISFELTISENKKGPGIWKFNNDLLKNKDFIKMVKKEINIHKRIYAATPYNPDYIETVSHGFETMIGPRLFWETLLVTLRGEIIRFAKKRKREARIREIELENKISELNNRVNSGEYTQKLYNTLIQKNEELIEIRKHELNGMLIRSRANWLEYGEKPSKFFLNLESKHTINKTITELETEKGKITSQPEILLEVKKFYENLYKKKTIKNQTDYDPNCVPKKISDLDKEKLEGPITKEELDKALGNSKNNKSPGLDGYSPEFHKYFWPQLGNFFLDCINENFRKGELTVSQSQGVITCLPKGGKARNQLKNWRPISLLNTSYKLISLCITNRIRPLLNNIISPEQKGFLTGRSISDCSRMIYDIINETEIQNISELILLVDFQKAFDSLSWDFVDEVLDSFNFGPNLKQWIEMFQKNSNSRIILNGHLSEPFSLERGCRQGDPISPYIFILCSEYLALAFKNDKDVKGIKLKNKEHKLCQYADDTSIFLEASETNLKNSLKKLNWFHFKSGLQVNITKTKVIRIGNIRETDSRFCRENDLDWVYEFTALGIEYNMKRLDNITELNIQPKIEKMEKTLKLWGFRNITPMGRITILKSLVLSQITHILQALPTPESQLLTTIENLCFDFIWGKKRHEVKKDTVYKDIGDGGLKMLNMAEFDFSLKITWLRKLVTADTDWMEFPLKYNIEKLIFTEEKQHKIIIEKNKNKFWKSVAIAYTNWYATFKKVVDIPIEYIPIWANKQVNIPFNSAMFSKNIYYMQDIFSQDGNMLSQTMIEEQKGIKIPFTVYFGLKKAVPKDWKNYMSNYQKPLNLEMPTNLEWLTKDKKGGQNLRKIWQKNRNKDIPIGQSKWNDELELNNEANWKSLYTMADKCKLNIRSKYFQYQVLHRTIITNRKLLQFNICQDENCDNCGEIETITHLLYNCTTTKRIWASVLDWITPLIRDEIYGDKISILIGNTKNTILVNYIFIILKHEIYKFKWKKIPYKLIFLKRSLKNYMNIELYNGRTVGNEMKVLGKWSPLMNDLNNVQ